MKEQHIQLEPSENEGQVPIKPQTPLCLGSGHQVESQGKGCLSDYRQGVGVTWEDRFSGSDVVPWTVLSHLCVSKDHFPAATLESLREMWFVPVKVME